MFTCWLRCMPSVLSGASLSNRWRFWCCALTSRRTAQWKVPGNLHIGKIEIPIGLALISLLLFATADCQSVHQAAGDHLGLAFSLVLFGVFTVSEKLNLRTAEGQSARTRAVPSECQRGTDSAERWRSGPVTSWSQYAIPRASPTCRHAYRSRHHATGCGGDDSARLSTASTPSAATKALIAPTLRAVRTGAVHRSRQSGRKSRASTSLCWSPPPMMFSKQLSPPRSGWDRPSWSVVFPTSSRPKSRAS